MAVAEDGSDQSKRTIESLARASRIKRGHMFTWQDVVLRIAAMALIKPLLPTIFLVCLFKLLALTVDDLWLKCKNIGT